MIKELSGSIKCSFFHTIPRGTDFKFLSDIDSVELIAR